MTALKKLAYSLQHTAIRLFIRKSLIINHKSRKGFTLIELMVAISIVAVISAIGYVNYSSAQSTARDARRKQDLKAMQVALQLYYQANKHYPCVSTGWVGTSPTLWTQITDTPDNSDINYTCPSPGVNLDKNYINQMPVDPLANNGPGYSNSGKNGYSYWGGNNTLIGCPISTFPKGQYYILVTQLENQYDQDSLWSVEGATGGKKILCGVYDPSVGNYGTYGKNSYIVAPDYH